MRPGKVVAEGLLAGEPAKHRHLLSRRRRADARGLLRDIDAEAVGRYCHLIDVFLSARSEVAKSGPVILTEYGNPIQNPAYSLMNSAGRDLAKLEAAFGLTPAARSGLTVEPQKTDELAAFIL